MVKKNLFILLFVAVGFFIGCEKEDLIKEPYIPMLIISNFSDYEIELITIKDSSNKIVLELKNLGSKEIFVDDIEGNYKNKKYFIATKIKDKNISLKNQFLLIFLSHP